MTETLDPMDQPKIDPQQLAQQLLAQAKTDGVELVGPNGLLNQLTATVLETALEAEMDEHLGYEKHQVEGRNSGNSRNGRRSKTVLTEIGPVQIQVPRDTDASFDPQIVKKRQRRLTGVDEIILSLSAKGLTTGEIAAHFDDVYGATVSKETISKITDKVLAEMAEWFARPLDPVYPVLFIDAIHVKIRDGQVANRPVYVAVGVTTSGERDILGLWAGDGGEGAKFWLAVLTEIKNRGVEDGCIAVCDGLKGLPETITTVWPPTVVQTCLIHLLRNTFRYSARQCWEEMSRDLRPVYTAVNESAAKERFGEFATNCAFSFCWAAWFSDHPPGQDDTASRQNATTSQAGPGRGERGATHRRAGSVVAAGAAGDPWLAFPLDRVATLVAGMVDGAPATAVAGTAGLGRGRSRPAPLPPELTNYR